MFHRNNTLRAQNENNRNHSKINDTLNICPKISNSNLPNISRLSNSFNSFQISSTCQQEISSFSQNLPYQHVHPWLGRKSTNPCKHQKTCCSKLCYFRSESLAGKGTIASLFTLKATCKKFFANKLLGGVFVSIHLHAWLCRQLALMSVTQ